MATIPMNHGFHAIVDDEDYERLMKFRWRHASTRGDNRYHYAKTGGKVVVLMHRLLTNAPRGMVVDHINGNGLDNRKANLRVCTNAENLRNRSADRGSRFKGVHPVPGSKVHPWRAEICLNGKKYHLGVHATAEAAARAYDEGAIRIHGEFARLNFREQI